MCFQRHPYRLPILRCRFHRDFPYLLALQPGRQCQQFLVVPNFRRTYSCGFCCGAAINTASIFLCTSMPATTRSPVHSASYTGSIVLLDEGAAVERTMD